MDTLEDEGGLGFTLTQRSVMPVSSEYLSLQEIAQHTENYVKKHPGI